MLETFELQPQRLVLFGLERRRCRQTDQTLVELFGRHEDPRIVTRRAPASARFLRCPARRKPTTSQRPRRPRKSKPSPGPGAAHDADSRARLSECWQEPGLS